MLVRNVLALIGVATVCNYTWRGFNRFVRQPLERKITEEVERARADNVTPIHGRGTKTSP